MTSLLHLRRWDDTFRVLLAQKLSNYLAPLARLVEHGHMARAAQHGDLRARDGALEGPGIDGRDQAIVLAPDDQGGTGNAFQTAFKFGIVGWVPGQRCQ